MAAVIAAFLLFAGVQTTHAVIPELMGPLQSLIALLPQLLVVAAVGIGAVFSIRGWRTRIAAWRAYLSAHRTGSVVGVLLVGAAIASTVLLLDARNPPGLPSQTQRREHATRAGGSWPTFRGDMQRSGNPHASAGPTAASTPAGFGYAALRGANISSSPCIVGGRLYVGSARSSIRATSGVVYCLDATNGEEIWSFNTTYQIFSSPVVVDGRVYIGEGLHYDSRARLYCLDAATGDAVWEFPTFSHVESTPTVVGGRVIFGAGEDGVYCLDAASGDHIWHAEGLHVDLSPAVVGDTVLVGTGYGDTGVYALDLATGASLWTVPTEYGVWGSPSVHAGKAYFGIGNGNFSASDPEPYGGLLCVDITTREEAWVYEATDAVLTAAAVAGSEVYFGSRDWFLYCVDAADGTFRWRYDAGSPVLASPAVTGDLVYSASEDGEIATIDRVTGELQWRVGLTDTGPSRLRVLGSPAVHGAQLFVGASKGGLFVIGDRGSL